MTSLYNNFETFALENNILASTAGFTIGFATKELVDKIIKRFAPIIGDFDFMKKFAKKVEPTTILGIGGAILGDILLWMVAIFITFIIATYIMTVFITPRTAQQQQQKQQQSDGC